MPPLTKNATPATNAAHSMPFISHLLVIADRRRSFSLRPTKLLSLRRKALIEINGLSRPWRETAPYLFFGLGMSDALVAIDAGCFVREHFLVHRPHEFFLLGDDLWREAVAVLAVGGIGLPELRPHHLGETQAFLL